MAVAQRTRARMEIRARRQSALIAGGVTGLCLIAVPPALLELATASLGLSETLPLLAPPFGWPVRIAMALTGAVLAGALSAGLGGPEMPTRKTKRNESMGWAKSLGLHHLARIARGEDSAPVAAAPQAPAYPRPELVAATDMTPRRRSDRHPDAPPRAPLMASRDLPTVPELTLVETGPASAPPVPAPAPYVSPVRDTTADARPRPLPRAPEPLSEADLHWVRGKLAEREAVAKIAPAPVRAPVTVPVEIAPAPDADATLMTMLDRFEQGVSRRIALRDAAVAMSRVEESLPNLRSAAAKPEPVVTTNEAAAFDDALGAALDTLRKLSAKAR